MSEHSKACCTIPPVLVTENYEPKGKYVDLAGIKTYVTGPSDAKVAIFMFSDIFGYTPQSLEGADILSAVGKDGKNLVLVPDFFDGEPANIKKYPPSTDEEKASLGAFFGRIHPSKQLPRVSAVTEAAEKEYPSISKWGMIGYCWGGKMAALCGGMSDKFKAIIQSSPAMVDPEDAKKVKVPFLSLPSEDEDAETMKKFHENLTGPNKLEHFTSSPHGFMSARANPSVARDREVYEQGYQIAGDWLNEHL